MDVTTPENLNQSKLKGLFNLIKKNIFFILPVAVVLIVFSAVVYLNSTGTFSPFKAAQQKSQKTAEKNSNNLFNKTSLPKHLVKIGKDNKEASELTAKLLELNAKYKQNSSQSVLSQMEDVSKRRREALLALFDSDLYGVSYYAFDTAAKNQFPESVKSNIEDQITVTGALFSAILDTKSGSHRNISYLETASQGNLELKFTGEQRKGLKNNIKVEGFKIDKKLAVQSAANTTKVLGESSEVISDRGDTIKPPNVSGTIGTAVVFYDGESSSEKKSLKKSAIENLFLNIESGQDLRSYFRQSSYENVSFGVARVVDHLDTDDVGPSCNSEDIGDVYAYMKLHDNDSGNLAGDDYDEIYKSGSAYKVVLHLIPASCFDGGVQGVTILPPTYPMHIFLPYNILEYVPTSNYYAVSKDSFRLIAHELGHFMGGTHASALTDCKRWDNTAGAYVSADVGEICTANGGADPMDVMGNKGTNLLNAAQRAEMGFVNFTEVTEFNKTYYLYQLNSRGDKVKVLKIPRNRRISINGKGFDNPSYYVEYRTKSEPFDTGISGDKIYIRLAPDSGSWLDNDSYLPSRNYQLTRGRTFTDEDAGLSITLDHINDVDESGESIGENIAKVVVNYDPSKIGCNFVQPTVTVSPQIYAVNERERRKFTISIKNNDQDCNDFIQDYEVTLHIPGGVSTEDIRTFTMSASENTDPSTAEFTVWATPGTVTQDSVYSIGVDVRQLNNPPATLIKKTVQLKVFKNTLTDVQRSAAEAYPTYIGSPTGDVKPGSVVKDVTNVCIRNDGNKCYRGSNATGDCVSDGFALSCSPPAGFNGPSTNTCVYCHPTDEGEEQFRGKCFVGRCYLETDPAKKDPAAAKAEYESCISGEKWFNVACHYEDGLGQPVDEAKLSAALNTSEETGKITVYAVSPDKDYGSVYKEELSKEDFQGGKATVTYDLSKLAQAGFKNEDEVWFCVAVPPSLRDWFGSPGGCTTTHYTYKP